MADDPHGEREARAGAIRFDAEPPRSADARAAMAAYFAELDHRFDSGFDPGEALEEDAEAFGPPGGALVLARAGETVVGCGGIQRMADATAEIKRMWIHPDWRGLGVGARLLAHLEHVAGELGNTHVRLDTNGALTEAIRMYEQAGYRRIERYNDNPYAQHWFEKPLG